VPLVTKHAADALLSPQYQRVEDHVSGVGVGYYGVHALFGTPVSRSAAALSGR
jgi:hypothetical protein